MPAVELINVNFTYKDADKSLNNINLTVESGECILLTGPSGCGKTTLLRTLNGLVPHYYPGNLTGQVIELGTYINELEIQDLSQHVGTVFQNPRSQFFCVDTESELAFACENRGMEEKFIRQRVEETVDRFALGPLLGRSLFTMSGGQKQQIACASIDVGGPEIILLDEPSANLDYQATELLAQIIAMWKSQSKTIIIADHRTAYLKHVIDRVCLMERGEIIREFTAGQFQALEQEDRARLHLRSGDFENPISIQFKEADSSTSDKTASQEYISVRNLAFCYRRSMFGRKDMNSTIQYRDMDFHRGQITAIVGPNGAGKTSFLRTFCGLTRESAGEILIAGQKQQPKMRMEKVFLVMQDVNHQLFTDSVREEIVLSLPRNLEEEERILRTNEILAEIDLTEYADRHPMSLSGGQKQRVAIGCAIASGRDILLFDEPTSGLDYLHMKQTAGVFKRLKDMGRTILIVTHDAELIHECCDELVHIKY